MDDEGNVNSTDDAEVRYTVRDLLDGIKTEQSKAFARIESAILGKADKADVARIEASMSNKADKTDVARIEMSMSNKADKTDVARIESTLITQSKAIDNHDSRLVAVEQRQRDERTAKEWWNTRVARVSGTIAGGALIAGEIVSILHETGVI